MERDIYNVFSWLSMSALFWLGLGTGLKRCGRRMAGWVMAAGRGHISTVAALWPLNERHDVLKSKESRQQSQESFLVAVVPCTHHSMTLHGSGGNRSYFISGSSLIPFAYLQQKAFLWVLIFMDSIISQLPLWVKRWEVLKRGATAPKTPEEATSSSKQWLLPKRAARMFSVSTGGIFTVKE